MEDVGLAENTRQKERVVVTADDCCFKRRLASTLSSPCIFLQERLSATPSTPEAQQEDTVLPQVGVESGTKQVVNSSVK